MEGCDTQELSAIQMNALTHQIVDVYHGHAVSQTPDSWARRHIHGLNTLFLQQHGFSCEDELIADFKHWLRGKDVLAMFANNPMKEMTVLNLPIKDMNMPPWAERVNQPYHVITRSFKQQFIPILNKRCCASAHSYYEKFPVKNFTQTEIAKRDFGFHCALYDAYELYLCYIVN